MSAKSIVIKTQSKTFYNSLIQELHLIPCIKFFSKKLNGSYQISIKCGNYYEFLSIPCTDKTYGNYIFLYSNLSIILSDLIIKNYENKLVNAYIKSQYFYFPKTIINKLINVFSLILYPNSPLTCSEELYELRKKILTDELLKLFRKQNYIYVDGFSVFLSSNYHSILETIISNLINTIIQR